MAEYLKFWMTKDLYEIAIFFGMVLAIFLGWFLLCFVIVPLADRFKRWQRRHWNRRNDDGKNL